MNEKELQKYIELLKKEDQDLINRASLLDAKANAFIFALITFLTIVLTIIKYDKLININLCYNCFMLILIALILFIFVILIIILFKLLNNYSIKDYLRTGFEKGFDKSDIQGFNFDKKIVEDFKTVIKNNSDINENKAKSINKLIYLELISMVAMIVLLIIFNIIININVN